MPRTLPWLKNGPIAVTTTTARAKPNKRQRLLDPDSDTDTTTPQNAPTHPPKTHLAFPKTTLPRSPSTSPPPAPPASSPMRPGLSADDIYIMVEDEFLSTAHTFTAHLHHAEYIRLKTEARTRNSSTISHIARPVDSITTMREETKRKKAAEAQAARTRAGVESIQPARKVPASRDESDESGFEEEEEGGKGQPWEGTQLQHFMVTSPKKTLTGLKGLQGVTSHTRAAAGYERPERKGGSPTPSRLGGRGKATADAVEVETSENDDDLDVPSRLPSRASAFTSKSPPTVNASKASSPTPRQIPKTKPPSSVQPPPKLPLLDTTPSRNSISSKPLSKSQKTPGSPSVDSSPERRRLSLDGDEVRARRRRMQVRKERAEREGKKSIGADEIPIFLV